MRVLSKPKLEEFWKSRKHDSAIAENRLMAWYKIANTKSLCWANYTHLRQTFGSADKVGDCVVFDVGNNLYRLIGRVRYGSGRIYVLKIMDHAEYDKQRWVDECRCNDPPLKTPSRKFVKRATRKPKP